MHAQIANMTLGGKILQIPVTAMKLERVIGDLGPGVAGEITRAISIPTIGIGSGSECDGQILVFHDLVGYSPWFIPKHVQPQAKVGKEIIRAAKAFISGVKEKKLEAGS